MTTSLLVTCPSYAGISDDEIRQRVDAAALERAGYAVSVACVRGVSLLDVARNELATVARHARVPLVLMLDDDVSIDAPSVELLVRAGVDIASAPYHMRTESAEYDVALVGEPIVSNGVDLIECTWTGLGAVLVRLHVLEQLHVRHPELHYRSIGVPGAVSCGYFGSMIVPSRAIDPAAPEGEGTHLGDDRAFSYRAREAGFMIHAVVDARTVHRSAMGCVGDDLRARRHVERGASLGEGM